MYIFFALLAAWAVFDIYRGWRREKPENRSRYLGKSFLGVTAVIVALFLFGPFFMVSPVKLGYASVSDRGVVVYYPSTHREKAEEILEMAKWARDQNDRFYRKETKTKVLVAVTDLDMLRFGVYPRGNGGGIPWVVVVRESRATANIIAHEMSHKNLANTSFVNAGPLLYPRWFDEGLANYLGKMDYYDKIPELSKELQPGGRYRRDITNWTGVLGNITWIYQTFYGAGARLIYGQTYQMTKYLVDTYGEEKVYGVIRRVPSISFAQAFAAEFGVTPEAFHREFIDKVLGERRT